VRDPNLARRHPSEPQAAAGRKGRRHLERASERGLGASLRRRVSVRHLRDRRALPAKQGGDAPGQHQSIHLHKPSLSRASSDISASCCRSRVDFQVDSPTAYK
jgi:hypothetical protein